MPYDLRHIIQKSVGLLEVSKSELKEVCKAKTTSSALKLELDNLMNKLKKTVIMKNRYSSKILNNCSIFFCYVSRTHISFVVFNQTMKNKAELSTRNWYCGN